jgi:hypothetical protein
LAISLAFRSEEEWVDLLARGSTSNYLPSRWLRGEGQYPVEIFAVLKADTSIPLLDTKMREKETKAKDEEQVMRDQG